MSLCRYGALGGLLLAVLLALTALLASPVLAQAEPQREAATAVGGVSPDTWRQLRSGEVDANFRDSRFDSNYNLINASGERWRQLRNRWVSPFGLIAVGGMILAIALFYVIVGRKELSEPRTGRKLLRWPLFVCALNWSVATLFLILALTGLNLLYGKFVFRPLFGDAFWASMISASKLAHSYLGPLFGILLVVLLARVLQHNWPKRHDLEWFRQGGGLVGKGHPMPGSPTAARRPGSGCSPPPGLPVSAAASFLTFPTSAQAGAPSQWPTLTNA